MKPRHSILFMLVLAAGACSAVFRQPVVTVDSFRLDAIGLRGGTLVARVHVENPNGYDLRTEGLDYLIEVAEAGDESDRTWRPLAEGEFDEEIRVPAGGDAYVEIPIEFSFGEMGGLLRPMLDRGEIQYRVRGRVDVEDPVSRTIPYRHEGRVTLSGVR